MPLGPGSVVGRYRLLDMVGRGGMGVVYRALDTELDRPVAVKLLAPLLAADPTFVDRFRREARLAAGLRHPNIVVVHDWGSQEDQPYLVMEFLEGQTLRQLVTAEGRLPLERVVGLIRQCAEALNYAHEHGLVHRDVKPGNIVVGPDGRAVLTDFGVARAASSPQITSTGGIIGTPEYLSPEQAMGRPVDGRSDLYSLAIVLYELLAGKTPFSADSTPAVLHLQAFSPPPPLSTIRPDLPPGVLAVVDRALAKEPEARFPTVGAFGQALVAAASQPRPRPADPAQTVQDWRPGLPPQTVREPPPSVDPTTPGSWPGYPVSPQAWPRPSAGRPTWHYAVAGGLAILFLVVVGRFGLGIGEPSPTPTPTAVPVAVVASPTPTPGLVPTGIIPAALQGLTPSPAAAAAQQAPSPTVDPVTAVLQEGDGLMGTDLSGAIAKYRQGLGMNPTGIGYRQLGIAQFYRFENREYVATLEQAVKLMNSQDSIALAYLALAYYGDFQYDKSNQAVALAVQADPNNYLTHAALGLQRISERNYKAAREELATAAKLQPNADLPQRLLVQVLLQDGDPDGALAGARKLVEMHPRWNRDHVVLGSTLSSLNRPDEAQAEFQAALNIDPQTLGAQAGIGGLKLAQSRYDEATTAYQAELQRDPRSAQSIAGLGWVAYYKLDYQNSLSAFRRAIELDSRQAGAYAGSGWDLMEGMGQNLEAEANFRKALELAPRYAEAMRGVANTQYRRSLWNDALKSYQAAADLDPNSAYSQLGIGQCLMALTRNSEARPYLTKADSLRPNDTYIQQALTELKRRGF